MSEHFHQGMNWSCDVIDERMKNLEADRDYWRALAKKMQEAMLTPGQLRQTADWIVKHGDLTNSQLLTAEILRQKADKAEALAKAEARS